MLIHLSFFFFCKAFIAVVFDIDVVYVVCWMLSDFLIVDGQVISDYRRFFFQVLFSLLVVLPIHVQIVFISRISWAMQIQFKSLVYFIESFICVLFHYFYNVFFLIIKRSMIKYLINSNVNNMTFWIFKKRKEKKKDNVTINMKRIPQKNIN